MTSPDRRRRPAAATISPRQRLVLLAVLPIGVVLLVVWFMWLVGSMALGQQQGLGVVQSILGLATSLVLIASGIAYRRDLRKRESPDV